MSSSEISFMAEYAFVTLLSLYGRLRLAEPLRLRTFDKYLEITGDATEILKAQEALKKLSLATRSALKRLQALMAEEVVLIDMGPITGKILTNLSAKYLPVSIPAKITRLSFETPANILLVATIIEVKSRLKSAASKLIEIRRVSSNPLVDIALSKLREMISSCDLLLSEPVLRPLVPKASAIAGNKRLLGELEARTRLDAAKKFREYRSYYPLLKLRRELYSKVYAFEKYVEKHGDALMLKLPTSKLYEIYGFTILLETLLEEINAGSWSARVDDKSRVLILRRGNDSILVSYNALPRSVCSRFAFAKAYGLLNNGIDRSLIERLGGLPDTIILLNINGRQKLIIVDYKYSRSLSYLVASRFKALSYLYEFCADCAIIVSPAVKSKPGASMHYESEEELDEEAYEHLGFYQNLMERGGAVIEIDSNYKMLAIVFADPNLNGAKKAKKAFRKILNILLTSD